MKNKSYNVEVVLKNDAIEECAYNCPRGLAICHHMTALELFAHYNISVTDQECKWNKKKTPAEDIPLTAEQCFAKKQAEYDPLQEEPSSDYVDSFLQGLQWCAHTGLYWLALLEPTKECNDVVDVEAVIFSKDYGNACNKRRFLEECLKISPDKYQQLAEATVGQSKNPLWLIVRKHPLTASNFGKIIKACHRGRYPPSLFKTLIGSYNLDGIKQIQWGRTNEKYAIEVFEKTQKIKVTAIGIWLHHCGFLGASPDGLCEGTNSIIEVKCSYKYREKNLQDKVYILWYDSSAKQ